MPEQIGQRGLDLIKHFEGLRLCPYKDSSGVWTIGYGHTGDVHPDREISKEKSEELLREDLSWAEQAVRELVQIELTQGQFDALVSFVFNLGRPNFERSTLLSRINEGASPAKIPEQFCRWVYAGCRPRVGLARRRTAEAKLYLEDDVLV